MVGRLPGLPKPPNSGRQKGTLNKRTGQQLRAIATAAQAVGGDLTDEDIAQMDALDVLAWAMRVAVKSNQVSLAASCAEKLARYSHVAADKIAEDFAIKHSVSDFTDHELDLLLRSSPSRDIAYAVSVSPTVGATQDGSDLVEG